MIIMILIVGTMSDIIRHRACAQACQGVFFMLGNVPVPVLVPVPVPGFGFGAFL